MQDLSPNDPSQWRFAVVRHQGLGPLPSDELHDVGVEFTIVDGASGALAHIAQSPVDAILIELGAEGEGLPVASEIRKHDFHTPIVVLTPSRKCMVGLDTREIGPIAFAPMSWVRTKIVEASRTLRATARSWPHQPWLAETLETGAWGLVLDSDLGGARRVAQFAASAIRTGGFGTREDAEAVELALAEATTNAIVHGNLELTDEPLTEETLRSARDRFGHRRVHVWVEMTSDGFTCTVSDDGDGFDSRGLRVLSRPSATKPGSSGITRMRQLMNEVTYSPKGNQVTMTRSWIPSATVSSTSARAGRVERTRRRTSARHLKLARQPERGEQ